MKKMELIEAIKKEVGFAIEYKKQLGQYLDMRITNDKQGSFVTGKMLLDTIVSLEEKFHNKAKSTINKEYPKKSLELSMECLDDMDFYLRKFDVMIKEESEKGDVENMKEKNVMVVKIAGKEFTRSQVEFVRDAQTVVATVQNGVECFRTNYCRCRECGEIHKTYDCMYDECHKNYVCQECFDDGELTICSCCGEIMGYDEVEYLEESEETVCHYCLTHDDNYQKCMSCDKWEHIDNLRSDSNNNYLCDECLDSDSWDVCAECGEFIYFEDSIYSEENYEYYCSYCYSSLGLDTIKDYGYKPSPEFYNSDNTTSYTEYENTLYLGVELEVDNGNDRADNAREVQNALSHTYCKGDGSLDEGFEIVTHPCTLDYHLNQNYGEVFKNLIDNDFRSHDTSTCGLHVHVNRNSLGSTRDIQELTIAKIMLAIDLLWDDMGKLARRSNCHWCKRNFMEIDNNDTEIEIVEKSKKYDNNRYYAINILNSNTVEFRLFKGTLNVNTFKATLQLVSNIVEYSKNISLSDLQSANIKISDIINYVEYTELTEYANKRLNN